jgi:DNA-binding LytR/AlgR family response regulator
MDVAIVEDDPRQQDHLARLLHAYGQARGLPLDVTRLHDGIELVARYQPRYDLLLLDVEMPGLDGLTAAARIREHDREVAIVLVSQHAGYAAQGYGVAAAGYLLKPVDYDSLARELDRTAARMRAGAAVPVTFAAPSSPVRLGVPDIVSLEAAGRYVVVRTLAGRYHVLGPLREVEQRLEGLGFFRCHHGYLLNLRHVVAVQGSGAHLVTGQRVPVSRARKGAFLAALTDHLAVRGA